MATKRKPNEPFVYGKHYNPGNWLEGADALRNTQKAANQPTVEKSNGRSTLMEKLEHIEDLLKGGK